MNNRTKIGGLKEKIYFEALVSNYKVLKEKKIVI